MAGRIVWLEVLVICGYQLLCPTPWLLAAAMPTSVPEDNQTVYDNYQGNNTITGKIWQITETSSNQTSKDPDGLLFRGGWKTKNQTSNVFLETNEGWLNSELIAKDVFIPYRSVGVTNKLGNSSDEWKKLLVKLDAGAGEDQKQGRISKLQFNERRNIPFQFHWQVNPKRFNSSKTT